MKFKRNFFAKPNLTNSYWAGFIAADGCVSDRSKTKILQLRLNKIDINHLRCFKKYLKSDCHIGVYSDNSCSLHISSDELTKDLLKNFNITPRKSLTLKFPQNLTEKQKLAFIVGYIDGDGSIYKTRDQLSCKILGTKNVLTNIKKVLKIHNKVRKTGKIYTLTFYGNKNAKQILSSLKKLSLPRLDRKWNKV